MLPIKVYLQNRTMLNKKVKGIAASHLAHEIMIITNSAHAHRDNFVLGTRRRLSMNFKQKGGDIILTVQIMSERIKDHHLKLF